MAKHTPHILELAKRGAALRLEELKNEAELLLDLFPDLRDAFDADELPVSFLVKRDAQRTSATSVPVRDPWSAGRKKAASRRVKRQWAKRRAGEET